MRKFLFVILFAGLTLQAEEDPFVMLDRTMEATQKSLQAQRALRDQLQDYNQLMARYEQDSENKELLFKVIKSAHKTERLIEKSHLEYLFSAEFLSEISLFSKVAQKQGIPRP